MQHAIEVRNLGKKYRRFDPDRVWTFQEALFQRLRGHRPAERVWVLRRINFSVPRGKTVGIIGRNGAGKSTLLRLLGGVGRPEEGSIHMGGRVGGLLDLGVGFHSDLTGAENIFISGVIAGLTRREVQERYDSIVDFAELREFINNPLRTYSSGMYMRLAFAVAIHTDPEILLIDEVLAVGDIGFQRKCLERISELKRRGCTIALVSHDPGLASEFCDDVLWLHNGRIQEFGPAPEVVGHYVHEMETLRRTPLAVPAVVVSTGIELKVHENRFGSLELELLNVRVLDAFEQPTTELSGDGPLTIELSYKAEPWVKKPIFGVTIVDRDGSVCYDVTSGAHPDAMVDAGGSGTVSVRIDGLQLKPGQYFVEVGAYEHDWAYGYDYHAKAYPLRVMTNLYQGSTTSEPQSPRAVWSVREHTPAA